MAFEGAEKLLEINFSSYSVRLPAPWSSPSASDDEWTDNVDEKKSTMQVSSDAYSCKGLRAVQRETWQDMLNLVKCQILSVISNEYADAYLLSESSLFVYPYKIILKTCGTTTLLLALPKLMELAVQTCSIKKIKGLFYSRKSFRYPESQPWPHSSWQAEVDLLDSYFGNGASYVMGNTTSEPWYLYVLDERPIPNRVLQSILPLPYASNVAPSSLLTSSLNHSYLLSVIEDDKEASEIYTSEIHDHTLEILMTGLCPEKMQRYFYAHSPPSKSLHNWIPGLLTDSYQFDPCGWSQNGLLNSIYTTIHVTPEAESSYASFETNLPQPDTSMIQSLLNIFSPSNITLTLFIPRKQGLLPSSVPAMVLLPGYQLVDLMINVLPKHYLFYGRYVLEENNN